MVPIFLTALVNTLKYSSLHNFLKTEIAAENPNSSQNSTLTAQVLFKVLSIYLKYFLTTIWGFFQEKTQKSQNFCSTSIKQIKIRLQHINFILQNHIQSYINNYQFRLLQKCSFSRNI